MTKICGIKLTHDAAVAGIEDGKLIFCVEIEKLNNNARYTKMINNENISRVLKDFNFEPDIFAIDGWKHNKAGDLPVASYHEFDSMNRGLLDRMYWHTAFTLDEIRFPHVSYPHMAGHIVGSYCMSPFSKNMESAYVISWDGGQNPRVHLVDPNDDLPVIFIDSVHELYSIIYGIMGYYYGPYKQEGIEKIEVTADKKLFGRYDIPGKLMSYIALGTSSPWLLSEMIHIYELVVDQQRFKRDMMDYNQDGILEHEFMRHVKDVVDAKGGLSDADVLSTVHDFIQLLLVGNAQKIIPKGSNLIFTGGSALNIKWNSALRRTGHFKDVFVPPVPNDCGSAIGVACCEMVMREKRWHLDWDVYSGPMIKMSLPEVGWNVGPCDIETLAAILYLQPEEPIVFLNGQAEIGPRALGNRSIFCSVRVGTNKQMLNVIKRREQFRPIAPICIEEDAPLFFDPGTPDPYMLFDHHVRKDYRDIIPAVLHLDNTARLQTISREQNPVVYSLLQHYKTLSGFGMLCNTSANLNGSGFFPDVASAMRWGGATRVWCNGLLYSKTTQE